MHVTTTRSSADLTKPNQTPTRYNLAKDIIILIILQISTPQTASRQRTHLSPLTYTGMQPHAPGQPAGDHPVPAHTECQNPSRCGRNGKLEALLPSKWKAKCLGQQWREGEIARVSHHRSKSTPAHHLVRQILVSHGKCKGGPSGHGRLLKLQDATADATLMTVQR